MLVCFLFFADPLFEPALGMKFKKRFFLFVSLDLPSRSIRQFVCFPPIFCTSVQLAKFLRDVFETLRNFYVTVLRFVEILFKTELGVLFVRLLQSMAYDFLPRRMIRR